MTSKDKKRMKNDNNTKNPKTSNPVTLETDPNMKKPVRGLDKI